MDSGDCQVTAHGVAKIQTQMNDSHFQSQEPGPFCYL